MSIHYLNAPCGSGKTYQLLETAIQSARYGCRIIFVQPTKELIDKTVADLKKQCSAKGKRPPIHSVFHGGTTSNPVAARLVSHLKESDSSGEIIFITHQLLPHVRCWPHQYELILLIDEAPQVHEQIVLNIPHTHSLITKHLSVDPFNNIYSRLLAADPEELELITKNKDRDQIHEQLRKLCQKTTAEHWDCFVNTEQYRKLLNGEQNQLSVHCTLQPSVISGFRSVLIATANFTDTMVYHLWRAEGVKFSEAKTLKEKLRFEEHKNGELVTIRYCDEKAWTKHRRNSPLTEDNPEGKVILDGIVQATLKDFGEQDFLWQANKDVKDDALGGKGTRLPNIPHGLNDYQHIDKVVFLSALLPRTDHFKFLETRGVSGEEVRRAVCYSTAYQSIMRTSIRNPKNCQSKVIIVPDKSLAEYLSDLLPGSRIQKLDAGIPASERKKGGRPRKYKSDNDRQRECRRRKKEKLLADLQPLRSYADGPSGGLVSCHENTIELITSFVTDQPLFATLYRSKYSLDPAYLSCQHPDEFLAALKYFSSEVEENKKDRFLIAPAIFNPNHPDRMPGAKRSLSNIHAIRSLWLDFEDGELSPQEFTKLFPGLRMVVMNTFSHTKEKPRYRVVIPFMQPILSDHYTVLFDYIVQKLEDAGYQVGPKRVARKSSRAGRRSGLDLSKRTPASLFYAPCQAEKSQDSFFIDCNGPERKVLDPALWIEHNVVPLQLTRTALPASPHPTARQLDRAAVEKATERWRQGPHHDGEDNSNFFMYAVALRDAWMPLREIEAKLKGEVQYARRPDRRLGKIPSIIDSLQKSFRQTG